MEDILFENVQAFMKEQPSNAELVAALNISEAIGETSDLKRIRDRRTTWFGKYELALRKKIDGLIEKSVTRGRSMAEMHDENDCPW